MHAVLTDVDMPGSLDRFEVARLVAQGQPEIGRLVISGKAFPNQGDMPPSAVFVPKPVLPATLVERLCMLMGRFNPA